FLGRAVPGRRGQRRWLGWLRPRRRPAGRLRRASRPSQLPLRLLLWAVILLPGSILTLQSWQAWEQSWAEATVEMERSAEAAAEYARRVLDGHRLLAQRANDLLIGLSDDTIRQEEAAVSSQLAQLVEEGGGEQMLTLNVFDAEGEALVSGSMLGLPRDGRFADRDYNQVLRGAGATRAVISGPHQARIGGGRFFAVTLRREHSGNALPAGAYDGVINVSVRIPEASTALQRLLKNPADELALQLRDGQPLAQTGGQTGGGAAGLGIVLRHPVEGWDVQAVAARPRDQIVARWLAMVGRLLMFGLPSVLALLALVLVVRRGQRHMLTHNVGLEQRVAERSAALASSEERLRLAQEASGVGVWEQELGPGGRAVWSAEQYRLLGLDPEGGPVGARRLLRMIEPADRWAVLRALRGRTPQAHLRLKRANDGALRWLSVSGVRVPAGAGRPARLIGIAADITDRHANAEALRDAEMRYRALFEVSPFAVFILDPATDAILDVNARACSDYGYSREEFRHLALQDIDAREVEEPRGPLAAAIASSAAAVAAGVAPLPRVGLAPGALPEAPLPGQGSLPGPFAVPATATLAAAPPATSDTAAPRRSRGPREVQEYETRYRTRSGGLRDVLVRVQGVHLRGHNVSYAAHMDITARKRAEEERLLLAREVDHRAKNVLTLVQAALRLTPKEDAAAYTSAVEGRVMALARAHTLLAEAYWTGAELRALLEGELTAFLAPLDGQDMPQVTLEGPPVMLPPAAAQGVSMVLHELATNATKHGALSRPGGRVAVSWQLQEAAGRLALCWSEAGGPPVEAPPQRQGFGSRMVEATIRRQLGGVVRRQWRREGLECELELPLRQPDRRDAA
ncbi:HWE histidine kinase domain-containing protein, partial [Roseomonas sp. 18066]|uniref:HWE histidine kinase domain-containing protein n=1 Tax=Roseomonas sp. 18066 TaxID=2681412 RepID=UPI001359EC33